MEKKSKYVAERTRSITPSLDVKLPSEAVKNIEKPTLKSFPKYDRNPFTTEMMKKGFSTSIRKVEEEGDHVAMNVVTGEVGGTLAMAVTTEVDRESFVKIYTSDLSALLGLSLTANRLFLIIMKVMQQHKDRDQIDLSHVMVNHYIAEHVEQLEALGKPIDKSLKPIKKSSFYNALAELMVHDIVAPCQLSKEKYWINPMRVFNGDRIALGKLYIVQENQRQDAKTRALESKQMDLSEKSGEDSPFSS